MHRQTIEVESLLILLCKHKIVTNDHANTWTKDNLHHELCRVNVIFTVNKVMTRASHHQRKKINFLQHVDVNGKAKCHIRRQTIENII